MNGCSGNCNQGRSPCDCRFIPYDVAKCAGNPEHAECKKCLRWHELPGQTWGPRTPVAIGRNNSTDEHCDFIEAKEGA